MENIKFSPEAFELLKRLLRAALEERPIRDEVRVKIMDKLSDKMSTLSDQVVQVRTAVAILEEQIKNGGGGGGGGSSDPVVDEKLINLMHVVLSDDFPAVADALWLKANGLNAILDPDLVIELENGSELVNPEIELVTEDDITYTIGKETVPSGTDTVPGGSGSDTVPGGSGSETVPGGTGDDTIPGSETVPGGSGSETVPGGTGDDTVPGGSGDETVPSGDDTISGGEEYATDDDIDDIFDNP